MCEGKAPQAEPSPLIALRILHVGILGQPVGPHILGIQVHAVDALQIALDGAALLQGGRVPVALNIVAHGPVAFLLEGLQAAALAVGATSDVADEQARACGIAAAILAAMSGCAKDSSIDTTGIDKEYLEAWMGANHPGVSASGRGIYILSDEPGTGEELTSDDLYLFIEYTSTDLEGNVGSTTSKKLSQQVGSYSTTNYYGDYIIINDETYTQLGIMDLINGMRVGGKRVGVVPGWLNVTLNEYESKASGSNAIYSITIKDKTSICPGLTPQCSDTTAKP